MGADLLGTIVNSLFTNRWFRFPNGAAIKAMAVKRLAKGTEQEFLNGLHIMPQDALSFVFMTDHRLPMVLPVQLFATRAPLLRRLAR